MGLLFRILLRLYLFITKILKNSLIDDPYQNQVLVGIANFLTILALVVGFGLALYTLVWAISLEIFVKALLLAYFEAWVWSKFWKAFTSFAQEMYLICSTVGYTVLIGAAVQIRRMPWVDSKALLVYWTFLLILGFIIWGITVHNATGLAGDKPGVFLKKIEYKQRFRITKIPKEIPNENQAQAYLKKIK